MTGFVSKLFNAKDSSIHKASQSTDTRRILSNGNPFEIVGVIIQNVRMHQNRIHLAHMTTNLETINKKKKKKKPIDFARVHTGHREAGTEYQAFWNFK